MNNFWKAVYGVVAVIIASALSAVFYGLYTQLVSFPLDINDIRTNIKTHVDSNFALGFVGTITGLVALFGGWLAILRSDEIKRQNDIAEETNEIAKDTNAITREQNKIAEQQDKTEDKKVKTTDRQAKAADKTANRQADIAEQELITKNINNAIESLGKSERGKPVMEARLGAVYTLERIAQDSIRDHIQIMEILCAYVRTNSPINNKRIPLPPLREDIQATMTIIGRRGDWARGEERLEKEKKQKYRLDFYQCHLVEALLNRTNLRGATFLGANLSDAGLDKADLSNVYFDDAILNGTLISRANTARAWASECDFSECRGLTQEQLDVMFCGKGVKIPKGLKRPKHWPTKNIPFAKFQEAYWDWEMAQDDSYLA